MNHAIQQEQHQDHTEIITNTPSTEYEDCLDVFLVGPAVKNL